MMGLALIPGLFWGLALTPCLTMVLALIPFLVIGLALYPFCRIWFLVGTSTKKIKFTVGIAFECHDIDGVSSYTAVLVIFPLSPEGF
jgi:hypothetical protein